MLEAAHTEVCLVARLRASKCMAQEYARAIARVVVAQLASTAGYERIQASAHESLADLLMRFLAEVGASSHSYAELAGRTASNVNDVLLAFEDMGVRVEELMQYAAAEEEVPFAHPVTKFPVSKKPTLPPTFADKKEVPPKHVPSYLPAFPDNHTYVSTPAFPAHDPDARAQRLAAGAAKRKAETALVNLHKRQAALQPAAARPVPGVDPPASAAPAAPCAEGGVPLLGAAVNPFLAQPLWEERVSPAPDSTTPAGAALGVAPAATEAAPEEAGGTLCAVLGLDKRAPGSKVEWRESAADAAEVAAGDAAPLAPFSLDWAARARAKALASVSHLPFEDAYAAEQREPSPEVTAAGRRRKLTAKGCGRASDPVQARAEQILALGGQPGFGEED